MSKIGIVTVLYNSEPVLEEFFQTLGLQEERDFTLYVVDNNSCDNSLSLARKLAADAPFKCVFFSEKENWGVAKGNNIGIRAALDDGCEYVLLSNNDTVLKPDTISSLLDGMVAMNADMAVSKIYFHDSGKIWYVGGFYGWVKGDTVHIDVLQDDKGQYDKPMFTDYGPTCFMLIKRDVFDAVGLMDEKYFVYYDDSDFVYRATHYHGKTLALIPSSILYHKVSSCTGPGSDFSEKMVSRNGIYFARKHFSVLHRIVTISFIMAKAAATLLLKFQPKRFKARYEGCKLGLTMKVDRTNRKQ